MSPIPTLILDGTLHFPAHSLLDLASQALRLLRARYSDQYNKALQTNNEDAESDSVENLNDVDITLREVDPVYWKELADKRLHNEGGYTAWTAEELARRADPQTRLSALLKLGRIPKAFWVVPEAAKLWRETQEAGVDVREEKEGENAQLDLLVFLSEKRERAGLFKLVSNTDS